MTKSQDDAGDGQNSKPNRSLSRRGFIGRTTIGAAAMGLAGATPGLLLGTESSEVDPGDVPAAAMAEPMVAQVRDFTTGEVSLMYGLKEVIVRDPQLVLKRLRALPH